jgi:serine protease Do
MLKLRLAPVIILAALVLMTGCNKKKDAAFYEAKGTTAEAPVKEVSKDTLATQQAFANVAKAVTPSVVNISTISHKRIVRPFFEFSPFFGDLFEQQRPRVQKETSLGSGFIINKDGLIVTNDHVIKDADSIQVKLSGSDATYTAKLVGRDPKTDIAVIKINAKEPLQAAVLADSDQIQVGQWAIAIGNPFGLDKTVTVGVISATGRSGMGIETYENFIQTDASINPGNSGGPLLNIHGEVVGINTAIVAAGQGIGFAIPVNMAKQIISQLISKGNVSRGWLGVSIQPVTDEIAKSFALPKAKGALINDVIAGSPAEKAGLQQGDVLLKFDGKDVKDARQLQMVVAETPVGKQVTVEIFRDGKAVSLPVTLASTDSASAQQPRSVSPQRGWLGLAVEEIPGNLKGRVGNGVLVADVQPDSPAAEVGFEPGDIIAAVNQRKISRVADYNAALKAAEQRGSATFLVRRDGATLFFALPLR